MIANDGRQYELVRKVTGGKDCEGCCFDAAPGNSRTFCAFSRHLSGGCDRAMQAEELSRPDWVGLLDYVWAPKIDPLTQLT